MMKQALPSLFMSLLLFAFAQPTNASLKITRKHYGDEYECIHLNMQPSLFHPALNNHKVHPQGLPIGGKGNDTTTNRVTRLDQGCPSGHVPIRAHLSEIISTNVASHYDPNAQFAGLVTKQTVPRLHPIVGSFAAYNIHNPKVGPTQRSSAILALESGVGGYVSRIEAGWMVNPGLFGDTRTRLYAGWAEESDSTSNGCYNTICKGFITTSTSLPLGFVFPQISKPNGRQYDVTIDISLREGRWELKVNGERVGYWPQEIVPHLNPYTLKARWGGEVLKPDPNDTTKPEMGDGEFEQKWAFTFNAYVRQVVLQHSVEDTWKIPRNEEVDIYWFECYRASLNEYRSDRNLGYSFIYGGKDEAFGVGC